MFCFMARKRLYSYSEGDISERAGLKVGSHLKKCSRCAGEYDLIRRISGLAARKGIPEVAAEEWEYFDRELEERLHGVDAAPAKSRRRRHFGPAIFPGFAAASAVAAIMIVISVYLISGMLPAERFRQLRDNQTAYNIRLLGELTGGNAMLDRDDFLLDEMLLLDEMGREGSS